MQGQQRMAVREVAEGGIGKLLARSAPPAAVVTFEPDARPIIQVNDGAVDLRLDEVRGEIRLIVAGPVHPALRAEVIAKLDDVPPAAAMVAAIDHAPALVPVEIRS